MKIHGKMGFADFQEDDIQLPGFYTNIPPEYIQREYVHSVLFTYCWCLVNTQPIRARCEISALTNHEAPPALNGV